MGLESAAMGEVTLDRYEVPRSQLVGVEGQGFQIFNHATQFERGAILASNVGMMQRHLDLCLRFVKTRQQFGQQIGKFQSISNKIADLRLRLELSRLLCYRASWELDKSRPDPLMSSLAKLWISESSVQSALDAIQIFGGRGYMVETGIEGELRDAIASRIYSGSSEIRRLIIGRQLSL